MTTAKKAATAAAKEEAQEKQRAKQEKAAEPIRKARQVRDEALNEQKKEETDRALKAAEAMEKADAEKQPKPKLLDGKPGSGAGLKPGDWFAPKSNPGAAAQVPSQPLQPESLQSHGKGILYDKDLDNGAFAANVDPEVVDAGPFGLTDEDQTEAERDKAERATSRFKQVDPDNPTMGAGGRRDATGSPRPMGSHRTSKNAVPGGSNSGHEA